MMIRKTFIFLVVSILLCSGFVCLSSDASETAQKSLEIGKPLFLFNGEDMTQWNATNPQNNKWLVAQDVTISSKDKKRFGIVSGHNILSGLSIMVNGETGNTTNILSTTEYGDCFMHIEFCVPFGSNSGVYFQGLYEIQVFDSYGKENVEHSDCGGIYQRWDDKRGQGKQGFEGHPPKVNASKAPGVWQSYDVIFRAPRFKEDGKTIKEHAQFVEVLHNGIRVHKDVELYGRTRASLNKDEAPLGPVMLQGDHGPVAYRNIILIPLTLD